MVADATEGDSADQPSASEPPAEDMATATDIPTENETTEPVGAEAVAEIATEAKPPSERFLLLTRDGPLVIDVVLQVDNEPYTNALAQLVERVFLDLKGPDAEAATWKTLINDPKFSYGQYGNLAPEDADQKTRLVEMYDTNRNSLVCLLYTSPSPRD